MNWEVNDVSNFIVFFFILGIWNHIRNLLCMCNISVIFSGKHSVTSELSSNFFARFFVLNLLTLVNLKRANVTGNAIPYIASLDVSLLRHDKSWSIRNNLVIMFDFFTFFFVHILNLKKCNLNCHHIIKYFTSLNRSLTCRASANSGISASILVAFPRITLRYSALYKFLLANLLEYKACFISGRSEVMLYWSSTLLAAFLYKF